MNRAWSVLILFFLLHLNVNSSMAEIDLADEIKYVEPEIRSYLDKKSIKEGNGSESTTYVSSIVRGDINGDGLEDVFVSYSINTGEGNFSILFQSLFINVAGKLDLKAERDNGSFGAAQGKSYKPEKIEFGKIICQTFEYGPDDGACCPNIKGKAEILLRNGKLIEQNISSK